MTPREADILLADHLMERRSRAGSVLSDEQAQEVERLLSPEGNLISRFDKFESVSTSTRRFQSPNVNFNDLSSSNITSKMESDFTYIASEDLPLEMPNRKNNNSKDEVSKPGNDEIDKVKELFSDVSFGSTLVRENVSSWLENTGKSYFFYLCQVFVSFYFSYNAMPCQIFLKFSITL